MEVTLLSSYTSALTALTFILWAGNQNKHRTDSNHSTVLGSTATFSLKTAILLLVWLENRDQV